MKGQMYSSLVVVSLVLSTMFIGFFGFSDEIADEVSGAIIIVPLNYPTIQEAIDNASIGDTVWVFNGTYNENVIVNKSIQLIGNGTESTIIDGGGMGDVIYVNASMVNISKFTLRNSGTNINDSGINLNNTKYCYIQFINCTMNSIGIRLNESTNNVIDNVICNNNQIGLSAYFASDNNITFSTFNNSNSYDISVLNGSLDVTNCTFNENLLWTFPGGKIYVNYFHEIAVFDNATMIGAGGTPNAHVWVVENKTWNKVFDSTVDAGGYIRNVELTAYIYEGFFNYSMQDMMFNASFRGYIDGLNITNASKDNYQIQIFLIDNTPPRIYNLNVTPDENVSFYNPSLIKATINETGILPMIGLKVFAHAGGNNTVDNFTEIADFQTSELTLTPRADINITDLNFTWNASSPAMLGDGIGCYIYDGINKTYIQAGYWDQLGNKVASVNVYFSNATYNMYDASLEFWAESETAKGILIWLPNGSTEYILPLQYSSLGATITPRVVIDSFNKITGELVSSIWIENEQPFGPDYALTEVGFMVQERVPDGEYKILFAGVDRGLNLDFNSTFVTVDNTPPVITLNSPAYNAIFKAGLTIDLDVTDTYLNTVDYTINSGVSTPLTAPFDIDTTGWPDGTVIIDVYATDFAKNPADGNFRFKIDSTDPIVSLFSPANNSFIHPGTNISLNITETNIASVNFTLDNLTLQILDPPYNISTFSWLDGYHTVEVHVIDLAGNTGMNFFNFTIDSFSPFIALISPANNSIVKPGTTINLGVTDENLENVSYSLDGGSSITLTDPYDIDTSSLSDGLHTISVRANDFAGHVTSRLFSFTFDSVIPVINLSSPANNSVIQPGTTIDIDIVEDHIDEVKYSLNGGSEINLASPYDINTIMWLDDNYEIEVQAVDLAGNFAITKMFNFTIDSMAPEIVLVSPENSSVIKAGTMIDLKVIENHTDKVNYTVIGESVQSLSSPYDINTSGWADGAYTIEVQASDKAGNFAKEMFKFTIDSTKPQIELVSPEDKSVISPGTTIDLNIVDDNLANVNYSLDGVVAQDLSVPYNIVTTGWADGEHQIEVNAIDEASNLNSKVFTFTIQTPFVPPKVVSTTPEDEAKNIPIDTTIVIRFNIEMNASTVANSISLSPTAEVSDYSWNNNFSVLTIKFSSVLKYNTKYEVTVGTGAKGANDAPLANPYSFSFTTKAEEVDTDGDNIPDSTDDDDDNDGYKDEWETFLGTDPLSSQDTPLDTDGDGVPDGDETNSQTWMDKDDDGDDYTDAEELKAGSDPKNPQSTPKDEEEDEEEKGILGMGPMMDYLVILIIIIIIILLLLLLLRRKKPEEEEEELEEEEEEEEEKEEEKEEEEEEAEEEEGEFECPDCGATIGADDTVCPECGAEFEEEEEDLEEEEIPEEEELEEEEVAEEEEPKEEEPEEEEILEEEPEEDKEETEGEEPEEGAKEESGEEETEEKE